MLIVRGGNWPEHRPWFLATLVLSLAAGLWYGWESLRGGRLAGGGSLPGFTFGVLGGLIVGFEMLLWLRKHVLGAMPQVEPPRLFMELGKRRLSHQHHATHCQTDH